MSSCRKGAFTHAMDDRLGMFDQANHSTIFLDEIGDLSQPVQTKLLRVLQDKEIRPLGSNRDHRVDTRILAATNRDLELKIREILFREDLFYRLLGSTGGNVSAAAQLSGMKRQSLQKIIKRYGIDVQRLRS